MIKCLEFFGDFLVVIYFITIIDYLLFTSQVSARYQFRIQGLSDNQNSNVLIDV